MRRSDPGSPGSREASKACARRRFSRWTRRNSRPNRCSAAQAILVAVSPLERLAQRAMDMRSYRDERLLARSETEGARRRRPRHPAQGGGEDLRRLDAHHREVPQTNEANRRACTQTFSEAHACDLRHRRGAASPVGAARTERRGNPRAPLRAVREEAQGKVSVSTMSRAVRKLGWTFKKVAGSLRARRREEKCLARAGEAPRSEETGVRRRMLDQHRPHQALRKSPKRGARLR